MTHISNDRLRETQKMFMVFNWQFIEQRFVPSLSFGTEAEAWAYIHTQIEAGKDRSRFYVERKV